MKSYNFLLVVLIALSISFGYMLGKNNSLFSFSSTPNSSEKLQYFMEVLNSKYVEEINTDSLVTQIIKESMDKLDPHSYYLSKEQVSADAKRMNGNFVGIGVSFSVVNDTVSIVRVLDNSPSKRNGVLVGDKLLIADTDTLYGKGYSNNEIVDKLLGEKDSKVSLQFYRKSTDSVHNISLKRNVIDLKSVFYYKLNPEVGYIKLNRFSASSYNEFKNGISQLNEEGINSLILDLRNNPGGYLHIAEQIADIFLKSNQNIVIIESNNGQREVVEASDGDEFEEGKLIVLVNGDSASASEVVAGAIQDNGRGLIVGKRTFGKGLIQQQIPLGEDAIRLTTSKYYTPSGRSIQKPYDRKFKTSQEIENTSPLDTLSFENKEGETVLTNGGIAPDVILTSEVDIDAQWNKSVIASIMNDYIKENIDEFTKTFGSTDKNTFVNEVLPDSATIVSNFIQYLEHKLIPVKIEDKSEVYQTMKEVIGLQLFDEETYYRTLSNSDPEIQETLTILQE